MILLRTTTRRGFIGQASLDQTFDTAKSIFSTEKSCSHSFLICLDSVRRIKYGFLCLLTHWHVIDRHEAWGFGQVDQMDPVIFDIMQFSKPIFDNYNQNCIKIPPSSRPYSSLTTYSAAVLCLSICQQHSAWQIMCIEWSFYRIFYFLLQSSKNIYCGIMAYIYARLSNGGWPPKEFLIVWVWSFQKRKLGPFLFAYISYIYIIRFCCV